MGREFGVVGEKDGLPRVSDDVLIEESGLNLIGGDPKIRIQSIRAEKGHIALN